MIHIIEPLGVAVWHRAAWRPTLGRIRSKEAAGKAEKRTLGSRLRICPESLAGGGGVAGVHFSTSRPRNEAANAQNVDLYQEVLTAH